MGYINSKSYKKLVHDSIEFISGKTRNIQKDLSKQMETASKELDYEKAAVLRAVSYTHLTLPTTPYV